MQIRREKNNSAWPIYAVHFSGIYDAPSYIQKEAHVIDCRMIEGRDGYCSDEAKILLRERIKEAELHGVHALDNGNYHYMSLFFLERIKEPFDLVVFDHHSDMQPSLLLPLLSCGNWIAEAKEALPFLQEVWLIGIGEEALDTIPQERRPLVHVITETEMMTREIDSRLLKGERPLYVSIDKDVLLEAEAPCNWDQGIVTSLCLLNWLETLLKHRNLLGIDICGGPNVQKNEHAWQSELIGHDGIDQALIQCVKKYGRLGREK